MRVADLMQRGVVSVSAELPLGQLEEVLEAEAISGVPVIGVNGELVGIVSKTDVIRALVEAGEVGEHIFERVGASLKVEDIMTREVVCVSPDEDARSAARRMIDGQLHRVLVVNEEEVVGIVTALDLLRLVAESPGAA